MKDAIFDIGDTGQIVESLIARDAIEYPEKDQFTIPDNGKSIVRPAQYLLRHDPERRPSHYYRSAGPFAYNIHDIQQVVQEKHRTPHIVIVYVTHREADYIRFPVSQGRFGFCQGIPGEHQIQETNCMTRTFRGVRDYTGAYGHHGHGEAVPVSADKKNFHCLEISIQPYLNKSKTGIPHARLRNKSRLLSGKNLL